MSGSANSPEGEEVLASIRRIVSEEATGGRLRLTAEMETPGKLVLSSTLRAGEAPSAGVAERLPAGGASCMRLEKPVTGTGKALAPNATGRTPETGAGNGRSRPPDVAEVPEAEFVHADYGFPWTGEVLEFRSNSGRMARTADADAGTDVPAARRGDTGRDAPAGSRSRDGFPEPDAQDPRPYRTSNDSIGHGADALKLRAKADESAVGPPWIGSEPLETTATPFRAGTRENRERESLQAERDLTAAQSEPATAGRDEQGCLRRPSGAFRSAAKRDPAAERAAEGFSSGLAVDDTRHSRGETPRHGERRSAGSRATEAPFQAGADCRDGRSSAAGEHGPAGCGLENLFVPNEEALRALAARIIREELLGVPNERLEDDMRRIVRQEVRRALLGRDRN